MSRAAVLASILAMAASVALAGTAVAANPPSPPPVSANTQPVAVTSDGQGQPAVAHCGATASAAGNDYSASPTQVSSSGTSSPSGCGATTQGSSPGGAGQTAAAGGSGSTGTNAAPGAQPGNGKTANADLFPTVYGRSGSGLGGNALWLGLLLLLALFVLLIGFVIGRRRPARVTA